ncbi:hypothetical protein [Lentilactobacillus parafarraginis]|uniref:hypothetical protein n=1 Tax=Lentilactobacillus parafarraginis TaxID=390842 RepID=UPI0006D2A9BF|nr:hypothetical protein [Lentilactobacillus parafarraginis]
MTSKKLATILGMAVIAGGLAWGYANRASANAQQITISTTTPIRSTADHVAPEDFMASTMAIHRMQIYYHH